MRFLLFGTALLTLACAGLGSADSSPEPAEAPPAPEPSISRPALSLDPSTTLCQPEELAWLHCELPGADALSVCTSAPMTAESTLQVRVGKAGSSTGFPASPSARNNGWTWTFEEVAFTGPNGPTASITATLAGDGWSITEDIDGVRWTRGGSAKPCANPRGELANLADYWE